MITRKLATIGSITFWIISSIVFVFSIVEEILWLRILSGILWLIYTIALGILYYDWRTMKNEN